MNYNIVFTAILFGFMENQYFGWNFTPQSPAELICGGIVMVIFSLSFLGAKNG